MEPSGNVGSVSDEMLRGETEPAEAKGKEEACADMRRQGAGDAEKGRDKGIKVIIEASLGGGRQANGASEEGSVTGRGNAKKGKGGVQGEPVPAKTAKLVEDGQAVRA